MTGDTQKKIDARPQNTLKDGEIVTRQRVQRRSVLKVIGAGLAGAVGLAATQRQAHAVTDSDAGQYQDPPGQGRGTGITDSDAGQYQDPPGQGRGGGGGGGTGLTDNDTGARADPAGGGRWNSGLTDSDRREFR